MSQMHAYDEHCCQIVSQFLTPLASVFLAIEKKIQANKPKWNNLNNTDTTFSAQSRSIIQIWKSVHRMKNLRPSP